MVLPRADIERIRKLLADETEPSRRAQADDRKQLMELSMQRRDKLMAIDRERSRFGVPQNPEEIAKQASRQEHIRRAKLMQDEEHDEVKVMSKVVLNSKCVAIRDAQIEEKKSIRAEKAHGERRLDMMMEMERLKALNAYEDREKKQIEDRKKGALVIRAQIEEREREQARQQQLKLQEQQQMLQQIEKLKEDEKEEAQRRVAAAQRLMEGVKVTNAEQIRLKARMREADVEEERRIAAYVKDKELRDQEVQREQDRIRTEKEHEIARLRALQEKAQDKQAELDALRAKRAQEAYEREWRKKERDEAQRVVRIHRELGEARDTQKREKEALFAEQAFIEYEEFNRVRGVQRDEDQADILRRDRERAHRAHHQLELKEQIGQAEEERRRQKQAQVEEGVRLKREKLEHEAKLEAIRQRKLQEMEGLGVPPVFHQELLRKRTAEPLRPSK